ncbi:MAG TPA: c-type cytochrome [Burkholderiales bacterium]|nr:c-type cytochrome [Burkholderiales bacterium]
MRTLAILMALAVLGSIGATAFVWSGLYDVSATDQHLPPTYWVLDKAMRRSIAQRGKEIAVPPLGTPEQLAHGLALYRAHCVQCHGAPGVAPQPFALGLTPLPAPLMHTGREWAPGDIYWVVKYGLKMTGMPAWEFRMSDEDIWAVVALVKQLPTYSPQAYRDATSPELRPRDVRAASPGHAPNAARGRVAIQQYACVSCHRIPGVTGPEARVGPPLAGIASRKFIGGVLPNTTENLVRWIRAPQRYSGRLTAMPDLGVTERDARDIAAYLETLE